MSSIIELQKLYHETASECRLEGHWRLSFTDYMMVVGEPSTLDNLPKLKRRDETQPWQLDNVFL
jgi:hypothetical protein